MNESEIARLAEAALDGSLSQADKDALEERIIADPAFAAAYTDYRDMLQSLQDSGSTLRFRQTLREIAASGKKKRTISISFNPRHLKTAAMAASVALMTSLITILAIRGASDGGGVAAKNERIMLNADLKNVKRSLNAQQQQIENLKDQLQDGDAPESIIPVALGGSGFALTSDGYIVTAYHVVEGQDSVVVQTRDGASWSARIAATEPASDVAILKITDKNFRFARGAEIPYSLAPSKAGLGTRIYTLGFPAVEPVYSEGYIASRAGYEADTLQYSLELPAHPGQSGAPVLDAAGRIVGIVTSKSDGATYAVSSATLLRLIRELPASARPRAPHGSRLGGLSREAQVQKLEDYTCIIRVYK